MALLFMDGFDHDGYFNPVSTHYTKWGRNNGQVVTDSQTGKAFSGGRTGFGYMFLNGLLYTKPLPAVGGFVFGMALITTGSGVWGNIEFFQAREGSTVHLTLASNGAGFLCVKRGTTLLATGTTPLLQASWYHFEFKGVIDSVNGSFEVRINGVPETSLVNPGPINTRNGGTTGQWDNFGMNGTQAHYYDDVYVCDLNGPRNNNFLGMVKVETIMVLQDSVAMGSNHDWIPSNQAPFITDHGYKVRENPADQVTVNSASTVGAKETYRLPASTFVGAIHGMQTNLYVMRTDVTTRSLCTVVRAGGTDYDRPTFFPSTLFGFRHEVLEVNPATGVPWVNADIDTVEVGQKVTA